MPPVSVVGGAKPSSGASTRRKSPLSYSTRPSSTTRVRRDHQVRGLDVAMKHTARMSCRECIGNAGDELEHGGYRRGFGHELGEHATVDELHHQVVRPSTSPTSCSVTMPGWFNEPAARASRSMRARSERSPLLSFGSNLSATSRPRRSSTARNTSPIPPEPSGATIR